MRSDISSVRVCDASNHKKTPADASQSFPLCAQCCVKGLLRTDLAIKTGLVNVPRLSYSLYFHCVFLLLDPFHFFFYNTYFLLNLNTHLCCTRIHLSIILLMPSISRHNML